MWLIDDDELDLRFAELAYRATGLDQPFRAFSTPEQLFAALDRVEEGVEPMPGLILIDIRMPGIDGFAVLEKLRARQSFADRPPVAFFTTSEFPEDQRRAKELGCGYYVKPPSVEASTALFRQLAKAEP